MMETVIQLKPEDQWREKPRWFSSWAPGWLQGPAPPVLARPPHRGGDRRRPGPGRAAPGHPQRLDHAHQGPHRHAGHRHPHPRGPQDQRRRPEGDPGHRRAGGDHPGQGAGHPQRPGGAHRRRLLPGFRAQARPAGPLRPERRGGQHAGDDRHRRRQPDHRVRRPGPLPGERPLRPGLPGIGGLPEPGAGAPAQRQHHPHGGDRRPQAGPGPGHDPGRERHARTATCWWTSTPRRPTWAPT